MIPCFTAPTHSRSRYSSSVPSKSPGVLPPNQSFGVLSQRSGSAMRLSISLRGARLSQYLALALREDKVESPEELFNIIQCKKAPILSE
jgi:hypothetical protein